MAAPSLSTEAGLAGNYPALRFNQRERKILASVKTYVDASSAAASYTVAVDADWNNPNPSTAQSALDRIAAKFNLLLAKLDADAGVTDTNYSSLLHL